MRSSLVAVAVVFFELVVAVHGARSWVDPDTPASAMKTPSLVDGRSFDLVFSDEFSVPGRRFDDGFDPRWTAIHKNDYTNQAVQSVTRSSLLSHFPPCTYQPPHLCGDITITPF